MRRTNFGVGDGNFLMQVRRNAHQAGRNLDGVRAGFAALEAWAIRVGVVGHVFNAGHVGWCALHLLFVENGAVGVVWG